VAIPSVKYMSADVDFGLGSLCHVDIGSVLDFSEVHGASVIRIKVSRMA
jgi:hypothetical protein